MKELSYLSPCYYVRVSPSHLFRSNFLFSVISSILLCLCFCGTVAEYVVNYRVFAPYTQQMDDTDGEQNTKHSTFKINYDQHGATLYYFQIEMCRWFFLRLMQNFYKISKMIRELKDASNQSCERLRIKGYEESWSLKKLNLDRLFT